MTAADDVFAFLETQGIAGGSTEWTLLRRREMDAPANDRLVIVSDDGGPLPEIAEASGIGDSALRDVAVQVRVRARAWDGDGSAGKAAEIFDALHGMRNIELGSAPYLRVRAQTAEPLFLGFDETGRPQHSMTFLCLKFA